MSRTVVVYPVKLDDIPYQRFDVETMLFAVPISMVNRGDHFSLYVQQPIKTIGRATLRFIAVKTEQTLPDDAIFFQTVTHHELVWHIYLENKHVEVG